MDGTDSPQTAVGLVARSQALFEAFAAPEALPTIDPEWFNNVVINREGRVSVYAWLGKGPVSHQLDHFPLLYFDHGEESYPTFEFPSAGPKGAGARSALLPRDMRSRTHLALAKDSPIPRTVHDLPAVASSRRLKSVASTTATSASQRSPARRPVALVPDARGLTSSPPESPPRCFASCNGANRLPVVAAARARALDT